MHYGFNVLIVVPVPSPANFDIKFVVVLVLIKKIAIVKLNTKNELKIIDPVKLDASVPFSQRQDDRWVFAVTIMPFFDFDNRHSFAIPKANKI